MYHVFQNYTNWTQTAQVFALIVLAHAENDSIWHKVTEFHIL